ncbi:MAG: sulfotransferase domain-containing protein [Chitinophagales bacterium]
MIVRKTENLIYKGISRLNLIQNQNAAFLIIGAQKAGTSTLFDSLCCHPQLTRSFEKEIGFFHRDKMYAKGRNWYNKQFIPSFSKQSLSYEATPEYLFFPNVAKRIYEYSPSIKLIIVLRDPVSRAYSAWNMFKQKVENDASRKRLLEVNAVFANDKQREMILNIVEHHPFPSFEYFVETELNYSKFDDFSEGHNFLRRGLYAKQIREYLKFFHSSQLLIIEMNELKNNMVEVFKKIEVFLDVKGFRGWDTKILKPSHQRSYGEKISETTKKQLKTFYAPYNEDLYELIQTRFDW